MKKVFLQDVVPSGKRSIRNIPLPSSRGGSYSGVSSANKQSPEDAVASMVTAEREEKKTSRGGGAGASGSKNTNGRSNGGKGGGVRGFSRFGMWVIGVAAVIIVAYIGSFLFVTATVSVTPKIVNVPVSISGSASANTAGASTSTLAFTIVTLSRDGSKEIPATGTEKVERKASGKIVIYNDFSKDEQRLVANTRFQTPAGQIFRIQSPVVVPGQKTVGGVTTPGSLLVTVYADQAGEAYNIGLSDFTIPGFSGDPKFAKITAKSDPSSPIKGGFVGSIAKISSSDAATAKAAIETQLKNELREGLRAQIPDTHVLLDNAYTFSFEELPSENTSTASSGTGLVTTAREKGSIYGILFDRNELATYLAERLPEIGGDAISIADFDAIKFSLENAASFSPNSTKNINFKITGDIDFKWNVDSVAISQSLAGKKRAQIKGILANFESINRASVTIHPLWIFTLPDEIKKIKVEVNNG